MSGEGSDGTPVLAPGVALAGKPWIWIAISAGITLALFVPCWVLDLHPATGFATMFYGPLIASYQARENIVWRAALGGLVGMALLLLLAAALDWKDTKALFQAAGGFKPRFDDYGDPIDSIGWRTVLGVPLLFAMLFPSCLIGSSVGEHLSVWRRKRELDELKGGGPKLEQVQPRKMTDEEIAEVKL